jgi:hypothetical protein
MTGQPSLTVQRSPYGGSVCILGDRWARLNYPQGKKRWHATNGHRAICGSVEFDHPRAEFSAVKPERGRLCKRCVAILASTGGL